MKMHKISLKKLLALASILYSGVNAMAEFQMNQALFFHNTSRSNPFHIIPQTSLTPDAIEDIKEDAKKKVITFPVPSKDGKDFEIIIVENPDGTKTVTIPGHGDITLDESNEKLSITIPGQGTVDLIYHDGDFELDIKPEGLDGYDNISCKIKAKDKGSCVIENFSTNLGNKIATSDKLEVQIHKDDGTSFIDGKASNLVISDDENATTFQGEETTLGQTDIQLSFKPKDNDRFLPKLDKIKDDNYSLRLSSQKFTHEVLQNGEKVKVAEVKNNKGIDFGIDTSDNQTSYDLRTKDGFFFQSSGKANDGVKVDSNSPIVANYTTSKSDNEKKSQLNILLNPSNDPAAKLDYSKFKKNGEKEVITAKGNTGLVVETTNSAAKGKNTTVNLFSDQIDYTKYDSKNNASLFAGAKGLSVQGHKDKKNNSSSIYTTAQALNFLTGNKELSTGNTVSEYKNTNGNETFKAITDYAYFSDDGRGLEAHSGVTVTGKTEGNTNNFVITGNDLEYFDKKSNHRANLKEGFYLDQQEDKDGKQKITFASNEGTFLTPQYKVNYDSPLIVDTTLDKKSVRQDISVYSANLNINDQFSAQRVNGENTFVNFSKYKTDKNKVVTINAHGDDVTYHGANNRDTGNFKDLDLDFKREGNAEYGVLTFKEGKGSALTKGQPQTFEVKNAEVVYYKDKNDPNNEIQNVLVNANQFHTATTDHKVDITIPDGQEDEKFSIFYQKDGGASSYKIFNEDGQRIHLNALDPNSNQYQALTDSIQYIESPEYRSFIAKETTGKTKTIEAGNEVLTDFNVASLSGVESMDKSFRQINISQGQANFDAPSKKTQIESDFDSLNYAKDGSTQLLTLDSKSLNIANKEKGNSNIQILGATALVATDGENKLAELEQSRISMNTDKYAVDLFNRGTDEKFKIVFFEEGDSKYFRIMKMENGTPIQMNINDMQGSEYNSLFDSIEYLQSQEYKQVMAQGMSGNLTRIVDNKSLNADYSIGDLQGITNSKDETKFLAANDINSTLNTSSGVIQSNLTSAQYIEEGNIKAGSLNVSKISASSIPSNIKLQESQYLVSKTPSGASKAQDYNVKFQVQGGKEEDTFQVNFFEKQGEKLYKIYRVEDDDKLIELTNDDLKGNKQQVLFKSVEYFSGKDYQTLIADDASGKIQQTNNDSRILTQFSAEKAKAYNSDNSKYMNLEGLSLDQVSQGTDTNSRIRANANNIEYAEGKFDPNSEFDIKQLKGLDGNINYQDLDQELGFTFGSIVMEQATSKDNDISVIQGKDLSVSLIDLKTDNTATGSAGELNYFQDNQVHYIDIKDIKDLTYDDIQKQLSVSANGDRVVVVQQKDDKGKVIGSHLLVDNSVLKAEDKKNNIKADIRVGVLEVLDDKLNNQQVVLKADLDGKIKVKKGISGQANFALKGEKMTFHSNSHQSKDKTRITNSFEIKTQEGGKIEDVKLEAGPDFLKDFISIKAKGGEDGGRALRFSFQQDKKAGTYYLKAEFKEGDKVKVKLYPFTLESKKNGKDALAELLITPKGQNYMNHLDIISSIADMQEVNKWLRINKDTVSLRGDVTKGTAIEIYYSKDDLWKSRNINDRPNKASKAASFGTGVVFKGDNGSESTLGFLLSGDSEISYQTNGDGVLKVFGMDMDKEGSLPATANLFFKRKTSSGSTHMIDLGYSTTGHMIDQKLISPDAKFFDEQRGIGGGSLTYAYTTKPTKDSKISFSAGVYENFTQPAVKLCYETKLDFNKIGNHARQNGDVLRKLNQKLREEEQKKLSNVQKIRADIVKDQIRYINDTAPGFDVLFKMEEQIQLSVDYGVFNLDNASSDPSDIGRIFGLTKKEVKAYKDLVDSRLGTKIDQTFNEYQAAQAVTQSSSTEEQILVLLNYHKVQIDQLKKDYKYKDFTDIKKRCNRYEKELKELTGTKSAQCLL